MNLRELRKILMMTIKIIIFDADNTLYKINNKEAYKKLYDFLAKELKIPKEKIKEKHKKIIGKLKYSSKPIKRKHSYSIKLLLEKYHADNKERILEEAIKIFWNQIVEDLIIIPEMIGILKRLKENFRLVIASEEFLEILEKKLRKTIPDYKEHFEFLVTPDIVKAMKPSKEYYEIVLEKTNLKTNEILVIGDSWKRDLKPAKAIGIKTVLLHEKYKGNPDIWIRNIKDLLNILG